jgi:hypothetical protein
MNWRRGLLLAGIHLVVAGSLLVWQESDYWHDIKSERPKPSQARVELAAFQEEQSVSFNPCGDEGGFVDGWSPQGEVSEAANLPITMLTGWHTPCTSPGPLGSIVEKRLHRTRTSEILILAILCVLVALEWLIVGGFPLIQPRLWWLEPGAFITICTLAGTALALIPYTAPVTFVSAHLAALAWLWWFGLLAWKTLRSTWRLARRTAPIH